MKWTPRWLTGALMLFLLNLPAAQTAAQDMREAQIQARETRKALIDRAAEEQRAAEQAAARSREKIGQDRTVLKKALAELEARHKTLDQEVGRLTAEMERLTAEEKDLTQRLAESDGIVRELVGVIRVNAKDLLALIEQNLKSAMIDHDVAFLESIAEQARFPGMADIRRMIALLFETIQASGEVSIQSGTITDRTGLQAEADILTIGNFTAAYRIDDEALRTPQLPIAHRPRG